jgi:hypothetical protein
MTRRGWDPSLGEGRCRPHSDPNPNPPTNPNPNPHWMQAALAELRGDLTGLKLAVMHQRLAAGHFIWASGDMEFGLCMVSWVNVLVVALYGRLGLG